MRYVSVLTIVAFLSCAMPGVAFAGTAPTFQESAVNAACGTSTTFSAQGIGTASGTRYVIVLLGNDSSAGTLTSATIGTIPAAIATSSVAAASHLWILTAAVPSGTTADIVANWDASVAGCGIGVYTASNINTTLYDDCGKAVTGTSPAPSCSLDIPSDGFLIGMTMNQNDNTVTAETWTNATKDYSADVRAASHHSGANSGTTGQLGLAITATFTSSGNIQPGLLVASFAYNAAQVPNFIKFGF